VERGESRLKNHFDVLCEVEPRFTIDLRSASGDQVGQTHRRSETALGQCHRPHADRCHATSARVHWKTRRHGRPGHQKASRCGPIVNCASHSIPDFRKSLPLVDENGDFALEQPRWIRFRQFKLVGIVQPMHGCGPLNPGARFADGLWTLDRDGRKLRLQLVENTVDYTPLVVIVGGRH